MSANWRPLNTQNSVMYTYCAISRERVVKAVGGVWLCVLECWSAWRIGLEPHIVNHNPDQRTILSACTHSQKCCSCYSIKLEQNSTFVVCHRKQV